METTRSRRCKRRCFWCFEGDEMKNDSRNNFSEFSIQPSFSSCNILIFCFCKRLVIQNLLSHLLKPLNYSEMMFFLTVKVLMTGKKFLCQTYCAHFPRVFLVRGSLVFPRFCSWVATMWAAFLVYKT